MQKQGKIKSAIDFLKELKLASNQYRKIGMPTDKDWPVQKEKAIYRSLQLIGQYKVTQVRPFLLALLECYADKKINQKQIIGTIVSLERFHFLFSTICQDRASGLEGKYTRAAKNLHNSSTAAQAKKVLQDLITYLNQKRPKETRVTEALAKLKFGKNYDADKKTIQTIFSKIESYLGETNELIVNAFSLEHVSDQSSNETWHLGIGNIIPLAEEINNNIGPKKSFSIKKTHYAKSSLKTVEKFLTLNSQTTFVKSDCEKWEEFIKDALYKATELESI